MGVGKEGERQSYKLPLGTATPVRLSHEYYKKIQILCNFYSSGTYQPGHRQEEDIQMDLSGFVIFSGRCDRREVR